MVGIGLVGTLSVQATSGIAQLSFFALAKLDKKARLFLCLLLVGVFGCALAHPVSRHWLQAKGEAIESAMKHVASNIGQGVARIAESVATVEEAADEARRRLALRPERKVSALRKAREYAAWVLACQRGA